MRLLHPFLINAARMIDMFIKSQWLSGSPLIDKLYSIHLSIQANQAVAPSIRLRGMQSRYIEGTIVTIASELECGHFYLRL